MTELKIGVQLRSLRQPLKMALQTAARLGARGVELDARNEVRPQDMSATAIRQFKKMLDDLRLSVTALSFYTRRGYTSPDQLDRRVDATKQALVLARALGTDIVINHLGRVPDNTEEPAWNLLIEVLRDLGGYGQRVGATLCAETGTESGADLWRLVQALPDGSIGVNFDPANLVMNGFSPIEAAEQLAPAVRHVHVKDAVRDLGQGRGAEVEIGRGSVDFAALFSRLEESGYRGYFTIERENAADPIAEIGRTIHFLKEL